MRAIWDRIGISASLLCVIHCLLTPALVIFLPFLGNFLAHGWFHTIIVLVVFPVAIWALWNGFLLHRLKRVLWLGSGGILFLASAMVVGHDNPQNEFTLMIIAGLILATAHFINLRACRMEHE